MRWALLCRRQAARYLSDAEPSIELAVLGRRVCEQLCAAIRDGSLDHRFDDVIAAVRATTIDKLAVANPGHLARPG